MLQNFFNSNLLWPSVICFFFGSFGYIVTRLWVLPILRYRRIKKNIRKDLDTLLHVPSASHENKAVKARLRRHAAELPDIYNASMPYWYRLHLGNREESPIDASKILMALVNTKNKPHLKNQIHNLIKALHLPSIQI